MSVQCCLTLLFSALLLLAGCEMAPTEPHVERELQAVVGGVAAHADERFSTVAILDGEGFQYCSGVLIEPTVVLTAAHCVVLQDGEGNVTAGLGPKNLEVVAGALDVAEATPLQHFVVHRVLRHPGFPGAGSTSELGARDDIALLLLERAVSELEPVARLVAAELDQVLRPGAPLVVAGYGARDEERSLVGQLFIAETPYRKRNDTELAAGGPSHADTCTGDSGGPAYALVGGELTLAGLASRSASADGGCGQGGIYTLVSAHADWIQQALARESLALVSASPNDGALPTACSLVARRTSASPQLALALLLCFVLRRRATARMAAIASAKQR